MNAQIFQGPARNYTRDGKGDPLITGKKYIVIHNTSNPDDAPAANEASWARRRTDGTSSHYYCDHHELIQSLDTDWRAQHVGSKEGNDHGISYEITGRNSWTRQRWLSSVAWDKIATQIAADCRHHRIEAQTLSIMQMKAGTVTGIVTHDQCRLAWNYTDHTDPGPGFPMDHLIDMVRAALNQPPAQPPQPPGPGTPFPLPLGHYFGLASGPPRSHGGYHSSDMPTIIHIQQRLQQLGYAPPRPEWADGLFEGLTETAAREFQRVNGLSRDGRVGPLTWARLFAADATAHPAATQPVPVALRPSVPPPTKPAPTAPPTPSLGERLRFWLAHLWRVLTGRWRP